MKKLLTILIIGALFLLAATPTSVWQFPEVTTFAPDDILYIVTTPNTAPQSRKITAQNFLLTAKRDPVAFPAAGCFGTSAQSVWDTPATGAPTAACVGTNVYKGVLSFPDTGGAVSAQMHYVLPGNWTASGGVDFGIFWSTNAITGNGKWTVQFVCTPVGGTVTDDPAYPTSGNGFNTVITAAGSPADSIRASIITGATLPASCTSGVRAILHMRLSTDGGDAQDTIGQNKTFLFAELTYGRS